MSTETQAITVDTDRLFEKLPRFFRDPRQALVELLQNARRASHRLIVSGTSVEIHVGYDSRTGTLTCRDLGVGITDICAALSVARSLWSEDVAALTDPAGMGLFALLAHSESLVITSAFGTLSIRGDLFFTSSEYRDQLPGMVDEAPKLRDGTLVSMKLKATRAPMDVTMVVRDVACYSTDIRYVLNGKPIENVLERIDRKADFSLEQGTVDVYLGVPSRIGLTQMCVVTQGAAVNIDPNWVVTVDLLGTQVQLKMSVAFMDAGSCVLAVCSPTAPCPVTPQLPERRELCYDQRTQDFLQRLAQTYIDRQLAALQRRVDYCKQRAKDAGNAYWQERWCVNEGPGVPHIHATLSRVVLQAHGIALYKRPEYADLDEPDNLLRSVSRSSEPGAPANYVWHNQLVLCSNGKLMEVLEPYEGALVGGTFAPVFDTAWPSDIFSRASRHCAQIPSPAVLCIDLGDDYDHSAELHKYRVCGPHVKFYALRAACSWEEIETHLDTMVVAHKGDNLTLQDFQVRGVGTVTQLQCDALLIPDGGVYEMCVSGVFARDVAAFRAAAACALSALSSAIDQHSENPTDDQEELTSQYEALLTTMTGVIQCSRQLLELVNALGLEYAALRTLTVDPTNSRISATTLESPEEVRTWTYE